LSFDFSGFWGNPFISAPPGLFGWGLIAFFTSLALLGLVTHQRTFQLTRRWVAFLTLLTAGVLLAHLFILRLPVTILPPPGIPVEPRAPGLPLFALLPAFLAGGWIGIGPAIVVGLATGLSRAAWESYSMLTPLQYAFAAWLFAWCVRQRYWGLTGRLLRQPLVAGLASAALLSVLLFPSYFAYSSSSGLAAADHVWSQTAAAIPVYASQALLAGLLASLFRAGAPALWHKPGELQRPPYVASLNRKLLFFFLPLFLMALTLMFWANIAIATQVSTGLVIGQMSSAAETASRGIPFFIHSGQNLAVNIASDDSLLAASGQKRTIRLAQNLRSVPFFHQITLLDTELQPLDGYPAGPVNLPPMSAEELVLARLALSGLPQNATYFPDYGGPPVEVVFAVPVHAPNGDIGGVLIGRADPAASPVMQPVINSLSGLMGGLGQGFILDQNGVILYHPDPARLLLKFQPQADSPGVPNVLRGAVTYQDKAPDGTRRLVLYYPVPGHAWNVAITVPNYVVLELAWQISKWAVVAMTTIGLLGLLLISLTAVRVTRPAVALAQAAQRIADGQLDTAVQIGDPDEIGQAALAFEGMRLKLRARLNELGMLLGVSQSVASSLNMDDALPPILHGALQTTAAAGARIVLVPHQESGAAHTPQPHQTFSAGPAASLMASMDRSVLQTTRDEGPAIISNLARARAVLDVAAVAGKLFAVLAIPLRLENTYFGALWLAWDEPHTITDSEISLVQTLAGQAAVSVANARLFEAADQGRQRLAAILASTPDAVVVTDRDECLLLVNPAAEAVFQVSGQAIIGRALAQVLPSPQLISLLQGNGNGSHPPAAGELTLASGRTLYASASPIIAADGSAQGRVCVLRDVTHFKELDEMKSEFVATVSHDLRSPLTFMRGYASMLPIVGALNDKQHEFADKIIAGVQQMTVLIDDLLDLGRIEAEVGLVRESVTIPAVIGEVVELLKPPIVGSSIKLLVDVPHSLPPLWGDATLLRQAITNLLENAIKYTPSGGTVTLQATVADANMQVIVSDTGPGIAPADQAHLFDKFFRVRQRGSTQVKGSGLGLAIVKSIAERHGGLVWVESRLGHGSKFFMSIPLASAS
jgi:PAS domain S-box-containing protein